MRFADPRVPAEGQQRRQQPEPIVSMAFRGPAAEISPFLNEAYGRLDAHIRRHGRVRRKRRA